MTDTDDIIKRMEQHLGKPKVEPPRGLVGKVKHAVAERFAKLKKPLIIGASMVTLGALAGTCYLSHELATKRQQYPIRNILYQVREAIRYAGGEEGRGINLSDWETESHIWGSGDLTKVGALIGGSRWDADDRGASYILQDSTRILIVSASQRNEAVQSGISTRGQRHFSEREGQLVGKKGKFITYTFRPDRGSENIELNILVDSLDHRRIVNEIVTKRTWPLGVLWGENYRGGTSINEFPTTPANTRTIDHLFSTIDSLDQPGLSRGNRVRLINKAETLVRGLERKPLITTYTDGMFAILPQESSVYLFSDPSFMRRAGLFFRNNGLTMPTDSARSVYPSSFHAAISAENPTIANPHNDVLRLRVENQWDLWPGNYWLLNKIKMGSGTNVFRPFGHYNNGGYTIKDNLGIVAKLEIKDFMFFYGDDVLYRYFLDKNGDGRITDNELIGEVLFGISRDENEASLTTVLGRRDDKRDVSRRYIYTFMAGADLSKRYEEFYLCNTIESFMLDQVNWGFGKHSYLGLINQERSSILLLQAPTVQNLGRALTTESAISANTDIVALLRAARRDYVNRYATSPSTVTH